MTAARDEIPGELLVFLHSCIDSVEQLQVLLLLHERRGEATTLEQLSRELRSSVASVRKRVTDLVDRHVLDAGAHVDGAARFVAGSAGVEAVVDELSVWFRERPHRVIAHIFARPPASIRSFSDAFQFRKEEEE